MAVPNRNFGKLLIASVFVGLVSLFIIVGMTIWLGYASQKNFENALQARDQRTAAAELRNGLQAAESSQRGFLLTGNQIYLAPFTTARNLANRQIDRLSQLLASESNTQPALKKLAAIVQDKSLEMDRTIALQQNGRAAEALSVVDSNVGKRLMDEANVFINAFIQQADNRLTQNVNEQQQNAAVLRLASIVGTIVILLIVLAAWLILRRHTFDLIGMRDEVAALNADLEVRIEQRTMNLAQANAEIQRFAYVVTHDLRAPLVNIMGFANELDRSVIILKPLVLEDEVSKPPSPADLKQALREDMPEAISFIRSSANKMDELINAILKLARVGQRPVKLELLNLPEIVDATRETFEYQLNDCNGQVDTDLQVLSLRSDRASLNQVFSNLLDNAIKYRSEKRSLHVVISNTRQSSNVVFEIKDNGRGIAAQDHIRVFEMFRRSGQSNQPGDGVGLPHVRALLRKLGGDIEVQSELDKGTTFRITLPMTPVLPESQLYES